MGRAMVFHGLGQVSGEVLFGEDACVKVKLKKWVKGRVYGK